jgi:hypothetical protein
MYQFGVGALFAKFPDGSSVEFGTLQDCNVDFSFDKKELYGRNQFPVKIARAKGKVDCKATYADIKAEALNIVLNGSISNGELKVAEPFNATVPANGEVPIDLPTNAALNQVLKVYNVSGTTKVPMVEVDSPPPTVSGTYYVDDANAAVAGQCVYALTTNFAVGDTVTVEGQVFTVVASAPGVNEFALGSTISQSIANLVTLINSNAVINANYTATATNTNFTLTENSAGGGNTPSAITVSGTGVITSGVPTPSTPGNTLNIKFATVDEGLAIQYQYDYTVNTGKSVEIKNAMMGTAPVFEVEFYAALDGNPITVVLNNCTSEKLTMNFKNEDFTIPDFSFSAFSDAADVVGHIYLSE